MALQLSLVPPPSEWRPPRLATLPSWSGARRVCVDVETKDEDLQELGPGVRRPGSYVAGVSFALEDGPAHYLPFRHYGGDNLPEEGVLAYLRDQFAAFRGELVGANLNYDLDWLLQLGFRVEPRRYRDVQVAEPLLDELQDSYSLQSIAERYGIVGKDEGTLREAAKAHGVDPKTGLWRLPARYVGAYAEQDARLPLDLLHLQEKKISAEDLGEVWELESKLLPVLVRMRRRGVRLDFDRLEQFEAKTLRAEEEALAEVKKLTGVRVAVGDVWKAEACAKVLREIGITPNLTPKTRKPKVDDAFLDSIHHEAAAKLRRARKVNKLRTTFAASLRRYATEGRIHCTLNQLRVTRERGKKEEEKGARFGRLSSSDPNLQQQPSPDRNPEFGAAWRAIFIPEPGEDWFLLDLSQQEPRWVAHYAELTNCPGGPEYAEAYRNDPRLDNHLAMTHLVHGREAWEGWDKKTQKKERNACKQNYLGLIYGMGSGKLCRKLGLPTEWVPNKRTGEMMEVAGPAGRAILDRFDAKVPFLRALSRKAENVARRRGYIVTAGGRRCRFPKKEDGQYDWTYKALNRLIQGTSADQMKRALVLGDEAGVPLLLQVHDEADLSGNRAQADTMSEIMRTCLPCRVPHIVDVEVGKNWGMLA